MSGARDAARARSRRLRRGSAYVEALIVTSLLVFLWMGALAFGRLYVLKLATVVDARMEAWRATVGDCGSSRDSLSRALDELARTPDGPRARALLEAAGRMSTRGAARSSVRQRRGLLPFFDRDHEASVETTTRIACNDPTRAGAPSPTAERWISQLLRGVKP